MTWWLWAVAGALAATVVILLIKIILLQKSADEICRAFQERLTVDTNTLIDISGRDRHMRRLAAEINRQLRALRGERQRFQHGDAELKQAVANISHDLRTPLTAINGYLDLLAREEKNPQVEGYLAIIRERAEALQALTEELFRFSVISATAGELHYERLSLNGVLEESIAGFYAALTEKSISPVIDLPQQPIYRELDRNALTRVFSNLLSNALKYSDGDLTISMTEDGLIRFSNSAAALDEVAVQRLFDRFYTVKSGRGGSGLGLSIAKLLTERMGSSLTAHYASGRLHIEATFPG